MTLKARVNHNYVVALIFFVSAILWAITNSITFLRGDSPTMYDTLMSIMTIAGLWYFASKA
jgi:hypothetical protein